MNRLIFLKKANFRPKSFQITSYSMAETFHAAAIAYTWHLLKPIYSGSHFLE